MAILDPAVGDGTVQATPTDTPGAVQHAFFNVNPALEVDTVNGVGVASDPVGLNVSIQSGDVTTPPPATAYYNVSIGNGSLGPALTTGIRNVAIGKAVLPGATTAADNIGIGLNALNGIVSGQRNIGIGEAALDFNVTGDDNIALGDHSGAAAGLDTHSRNIVIGKLAGLGIASDSNVCIGPLANTPNGAADKQLNLANVLMADAQGFAGSGVLARVGGSGSLATQSETLRAVQVNNDSTPAFGVQNTGTNAAISRTYVGTRDPSGLVSADAGSLYIRVSAAASALYINRSAADPGTSWSLVTAVP